MDFYSFDYHRRRVRLVAATSRSSQPLDHRREYCPLPRINHHRDRRMRVCCYRVRARPSLQHLCRGSIRSPPEDQQLLPFCPAPQLSRGAPRDGGLGARVSEHHRSALNGGNVRAYHRAHPCRRRFSGAPIRRTISLLSTTHPLATVAIHLLNVALLRFNDLRSHSYVIGTRTCDTVPGLNRHLRKVSVVTLSRIALPVLCAISALVTLPVAVSTSITQSPLPVILARIAW